MTRQSLRLSDTAMALLRHYDVLDYQHLKDVLNDPVATLTREYVHEVKSDMLKHAVFRNQIQSEFLREVWLLWTFHDIPIARSLEWHFVLDNEFMVWIDQNHVLLQSEDFEDRVERNNFFSLVYKAYTMACEAVSTGSEKDQA